MSVYTFGLQVRRERRRVPRVGPAAIPSFPTPPTTPIPATLDNPLSVARPRPGDDREDGG